MEVGAAVGVAMEGGLLPWGDGKATYALIQETVKGTKNGKLIGNGCVATGKALGVKRIPQVKGQSLAAYDPRVLKGTGVTYSTCPMGADNSGQCPSQPGKPRVQSYLAYRPEPDLRVSSVVLCCHRQPRYLSFCVTTASRHA